MRGGEQQAGYEYHTLCTTCCCISHQDNHLPEHPTSNTHCPPLLDIADLLPCIVVNPVSRHAPSPSLEPPVHALFLIRYDFENHHGLLCGLVRG